MEAEKAWNDSMEAKKAENLENASPHTELPRKQEVATDALNKEQEVTDALQKILSKMENTSRQMDDQFHEIKETLYFRRIRQNPDSENPSKSPAHPAVSASRTVSTTGRNKSSSKVVPGPDTRADNVGRSVSTRRREEASIMGVSLAYSSFKRQRDVRPLPPSISNLYDGQFHHICSSFSVDKFTGHKYKSCSLCRCERDIGLDKYSRDMLWKSCTPAVYYWLLFTGTIPTHRVPWLLPLFWCAIIGYKLVFLSFYVLDLIYDTLCNHIDDNCISASWGLSYSGTWILYTVFQVLCVCSNLFILAPLLQSRELRCLLRYVGHSRVRGSKAYNIIMILCPIVLLVLGTIQYTFYLASSTQATLVSLEVYLLLSPIEICCGIAAYSTTFVFGLFYNSVHTCYADFAVDVLESANQPLKLYTPGGSPEVVLMNQLERIVSLSAPLTKRARVALLLPLLCGFTNVFWALVTGILKAEFIRSTVLDWAAKLIIPAFLPLVFALLTTYASDMLERLVMLCNYLNLANCVRNNPTDWMLTHRTALSIGLFAKVSTVVVLLGTVGGALEIASSVFQNSPLWQPWYFDSGSCSDGQWSGLEQYVDCGGPVSGCPSTCLEKYGDYLLIEGSRNCADIDGYVEIRTQRACEIAYASFERKRTNASTLKRVPVSVVLTTNDTNLANVSISDLRCGSDAHTTNALGLKQVHFPTLISAAAFESSSAIVTRWRSDPTTAFITVNSMASKHFTAGVLCMAQAHTCAPTIPGGWRESMTCRAESPSPSNATWRVVSQPWVNLTSLNVLNWQSVKQNRMSVKAQGNCAHVKLNSFTPQYGGHIVLRISCTPGRTCNVLTRVRTEDCSKVSALVSFSKATRNDTKDLSVVCRSKEGLQTKASSNDHVHIIADVKSGPFEIDFCVTNYT